MLQIDNPHASLMPGAQLGRYRIDTLIGAGGMAAVYRAYDTLLKRPLAIKVLARWQEAQSADDLLLREAQTASALNHSNICTVYEVGAERGLAFIAMEYVDGPALAATIAGGPLSVEDTLRYGIEVANALAHAHDRGVVHRDLKAANVILSSSGHLKIVDFGIARRLDPEVSDAATLASVTATGTTIGTPYAMAPEQVRGAHADDRTDVWALGVLLYEMLSGSRPFPGATVGEMFASILRDPPAPFGGTRVPERLRRVIDTCLAKDAARRYQRADDVRRALEEIAAGSHGASGSAPESAAAAPLPRPPLIDKPAREVVFVGRERETRELAEAWARARGRQRQLVLLSGEPGIGKTRLSLEFARRCADEPAHVLAGRCDEEALIPYQPFVEALSWYARTCPEPDLRAALAEAGGGGELGPVVPDFLTRIPDLPPPTPMNAQGQRYRLFETVSALLAATSKAFPVLLLIDDLHWADKPTLSLLRHIVRGSDPAALCVIGTYRESELVAGHPLGELLADLRREQAVTRVSLGGLERQQVGMLVETVASSVVSSALAKQLTDSTGGNPFFVGEMLRHLQETGALTQPTVERSGAIRMEVGLPEGVREVILRRVSRLSEGCNRGLTLASVLGREFDLEVLQAFDDLTEDQLLDGIDEARRAQLVDEAPGRPGRYSFHHALIRDTLYDGLAAPRRLRLHRRAGEALERLTEGSEPPLADLAHHFVHARVADKAADYATRAADRMTDALAHEEATRFYDMALQSIDALPPSDARKRQWVEVQRRRGRAFSNLGQWAQQRVALEQALEHLQGDQTNERCEILSELAQSYFWLFDIPSLERASTEALSLAQALGRDDLAASAMGWLARCRQAGGNLLEAIEMDRATIDRFGAAARISLAIGSATLYWAGRGSAAVAMGARAIEQPEQSRDATFTMYTLSHYAISLAAVGRYADAARVFEESVAFGRKYGTLPMVARTISMSAGSHLSLGDLDGAEAIQREARELAQSVNFPPSVVSPGIDLLLIAARRHDPGGVESLLQETVAASKRNPGWHGWLWDLRLSQVRAELAFARGEWDTAIVEATEGIDQCRRVARPKYEALGLVTRAMARHQLGRMREAIEDALQAVQVARAIEDPALLLRALDAWLQLDGDVAGAAEARATMARILDELRDEQLRRRFLDWEVAQRVQRL